MGDAEEIADLFVRYPMGLSASELKQYDEMFHENFKAEIPSVSESVMCRDTARFWCISCWNAWFNFFFLGAVAEWRRPGVNESLRVGFSAKSPGERLSRLALAWQSVDTAWWEWMGSQGRDGRTGDEHSIREFCEQQRKWKHRMLKMTHAAGSHGSLHNENRGHAHRRRAQHSEARLSGLQANGQKGKSHF